MKVQRTNGQEEATMQRKHFKIRIGLSLVVLVVALGLVSGVSARVPVEPGPGSPVTQSQPRKPAQQHAKKATRRNDGGFPSLSGVHVRNAAEARTE
jgi:hypothetical protein